MCDRPYLIPNPYRGLETKGLNYLHDTISAFIRVPCGFCDSCIALKQAYFVQRCQMESLDNDLFFCTLTYQNSMIPTVDVNEFHLKYPDWSDVTNFLKRVRKRKIFKDGFRYFAVSEYGGNNHRPHYHIIFSVPKVPQSTYADIISRERQYYKAIFKEWSRNVGSKRKPIYKPLCKLILTSSGRTYDFHYVDPVASKEGEADVAYYVSKYVLKSDPYIDKLKSALKLNLGPEEFDYYWSLLKPKCCISKHWGNPHSQKVQSHIRKGIDTALYDNSLYYPIFINPVTGKEFPLSPYYRKRFLTVDDAHTFYFRKPLDADFMDEYNLTDVQRSDEHFAFVRDKVSVYTDSYNYLDID